MTATVQTAITEGVWNQVLTANKQALVTNSGGRKVRLVVAASLPSASSTIGHLMGKASSMVVSTSASEQLYAFSQNGAGRLEITEGITNQGVKIVSSVYGNYPETWHNQSSATAGDALDNTVFGELNSIAMYEGVIFQNTTANVTIQVSIDGTTFIAADHPFIDMGVAARTIVTGTNTNVGPFLCNTPGIKGIRFLNEGAAQATVTYALVGKVGGL